MKVYRYSASGLYIGEAEAEESLLEEGKYLMPANSTEIPPPAFGEGEWPVFRNGVWTISSMEADSFLENDVYLMESDDYSEIDDREEERRAARENISTIVQIMEIEITEQHRAVREFLLTGNRQWLENIDAKISELRRRLI